MIRPWSLVHDVGTGDFFNAESFWSPAKKAALTTVHHATLDGPGSGSLIAAMRACPDFRHVLHRELQYPTEQPPGSVPTMRDHAITHRLTYHGSSFLAAPLDGVAVPAGLPGRFAFIQPSTPKNGPACTRFLQPEEWPVVLDRLAELDAVGVVINTPGGRSKVPDHGRLIDWTGLTTMPQSIEILKRSIAYIGVDSCFAILAAQLLGPDRLWVRCNNPYLFEFPWLTYPPQVKYGFLYPRLDRPPHPSPASRPSPGTIVELRCNALVGNRNYGGKALVEVEPDRAARMLACGQAVAVPAEDLDP